MPLTYYRSHSGAEVALWRADEPLDFFRKALIEQSFPLGPGEAIKHPEKARQWYASRYLLTVMFPQAIQTYAERKPLLFNGPEISFSHSRTTVAVMLSQNPSGIDVQWADPTLERIMARYTTVDECGMVQGKDSLEVLAHIWAVKEAVFKRYVTGMPFKEIRIIKHDPVTDITKVQVRRESKNVEHLLATPYLGDLALAYLIE